MSEIEPATYNEWTLTFSAPRQIFGVRCGAPGPCYLADCARDASGACPRQPHPFHQPAAKKALTEAGLPVPMVGTQPPIVVTPAAAK